MGAVSKFYPRHGEAVTPHNSNEQNFMGLYVGTAGNLVIRLQDDDSNVTLKNVSGWVPLEVKLVVSTGTTADDIVGFRMNG